MKHLFITLLLLLMGITSSSQNLKNLKNTMNTQNNYPKSLASYNDFKNLMNEVEGHRVKHLISLDTFIKMSKENDVVILDTRSVFRYKRKHLKGAIHLNFSDFTQNNLQKLIPYNTKILIYCNNNFEGDQVDFASKMMVNLTAEPSNNTKSIETQILSNQKPIMLALNIPTYINLYGYGYRNIYELDELVNVNDPRIEFEGTVVE